MAYYTLDPDLRRVADRWGLDPRLIAAVQTAEGGTRAHLIKAVKCSVLTGWDGLTDALAYERALEITCRSATHRLSDYVRMTDPKGFVDYFASKWAPQGVANDPHHLNVHWPVNVLARVVPEQQCGAAECGRGCAGRWGDMSTPIPFDWWLVLLSGSRPTEKE
jgi:hypothetical protein